jgi:hypothetical protein
MRYRAMMFASLLVLLAACAGGSGKSATLVLKDPYWQRVHVEAVVTRSDDCSRKKSYIAVHKFEMGKGETHSVTAPDAQNICWRHDRNPNDPTPGLWSDWSRATMFPGQTVSTDL